MKKLKENGFTLIEALLSLMISLLISSMICMIFSVLLHLLNLKDVNQDQYAILQLRERCALANCRVENGQMILEMNHESYGIFYDRHRLVKEKGYEILLENIDNAYFERKEGFIYLYYQKGNQFFSFEIK